MRFYVPAARAVPSRSFLLELLVAWRDVAARSPTQILRVARTGCGVAEDEERREARGAVDWGCAVARDKEHSVPGADLEASCPARDILSTLTAEFQTNNVFTDSRWTH